MSDWSSRRRVNLSELQRDLAQVVPAEAEDFEALADTVTALLKRSKSSELTKQLNKAAIWDRVMAEMDSTNDPAREAEQDQSGATDSSI